MCFGNDLACEFQKLIRNGKYQEVELITKLQDALINLANEKYHYAIDIIHGERSMVEFQYNENWVAGLPMGTMCKCEMSDMMFIVFSEKHDDIRLMYMQNKKGKSSRKFKADLVQLCLLKNRCEITSLRLPTCAFGDRQVLQNALLPSVGSYGVFYPENNAIDMAYYPAANISLITANAKKADRMVRFNRDRFGQTDKMGSYEENQGEETLNNFGNALVDMKIGTPILRRGFACDAVLSFLCNNIPRFSETRFVAQRDFVNNNVAHDFSGIPFACVIDADALQG